MIGMGPLREQLAGQLSAVRNDHPYATRWVGVEPRELPSRLIDPRMISDEPSKLFPAQHTGGRKIESGPAKGFFLPPGNEPTTNVSR